MQEKTTRLSNYAKQIGLKISQKKTELMTSPSPIRVNGEDLVTTEEFTYQGSIVRYMEEQATKSGMHSECSSIYEDLNSTASTPN